MKIGIDIDDTLTNTTEVANSYLHQNGRYESVSDFHDLDQEAYEKFLTDNLKQIVLNNELKKDAKSILQKWHERGNKLIFVTARGSENQLESIFYTSLYFQLHGVCFDEIIFLKKHKDKTALREKIDIFIDDKESILDEISKTGIKVVKMASKDKQSKYDMVNNWLELDKYLESIGDGFNG